MLQRCLSFLLVMTALAGCGLKGPLYRVDEPQAVQSSEPKAEGDTSDSEAKKLQRPRPSPQAQKEAHKEAGKLDGTVPSAPVDQDNADTRPAPADESR